MVTQKGQNIDQMYNKNKGQSFVALVILSYLWDLRLKPGLQQFSKKTNLLEKRRKENPAQDCNQVIMFA